MEQQKQDLIEKFGRLYEEFTQEIDEFIEEKIKEKFNSLLKQLGHGDSPNKIYSEEEVIKIFKILLLNK